VGPAEPGQVERSAHHRLGVVPDLGGIVLHPAGSRIKLAVLSLVIRDDGGIRVEDDAARRRGALVDGGDVPRIHLDSLPYLARFRTKGPSVFNLTNARASRA